MTLINDSKTLRSLCKELDKQPFICVDTEFIRERTYWPKLCLIQICGPNGKAFAIDPLSEKLDLSPIFSLMKNPQVIKVLHAAHQDLEIFLHLTGQLPNPVFDTQIAAMVCGFGESASYETLARKIASARIDKSSRFSDWSHRPLDERQLQYALADVLHLPLIYTRLQQQLNEANRISWIADEMAALGKIEEYIIEPTNYWQRIKTKGASSRTLAILREVAAVREKWARHQDIPRQYVVKDQSLLEMSSSQPKTVEQLARVRGLQSSAATGKLGTALLEAIRKGLSLKADECPRPARRSDNLQISGAIIDLLKVLLKMRCDEHSIAPKLVAKSSDLAEIAAGIKETPALAGWRKEIFGQDALKLLDGELSLMVKNNHIELRKTSKQRTDVSAR